MATASFFPRRNCYRVRYSLTLGSMKKRRAKYAPTEQAADILAARLTKLEQATRTGIASHQDIGDWIRRGWTTVEEADTAFVGFADSTARTQHEQPRITDYDRILCAYKEYSERNTKDDIYRKNHGINMGRAEKVIEWFKARTPDLQALTTQDIEQYVDGLKARYAPWTVSHFLTALRILLDQAVRFEMIEVNLARKVRIKQPKKVKQRRILDHEEIDWILETSPKYRQWISGSLPTLVRLGLYAGLRNQEMIWLRWDAIDWKNRIITIGHSECDSTGETWIPKDHEMRRLDVKESLIEHLQREHERQEKEEILGPFVMPGGGGTRPRDLFCRPLSPIALQRTFKRFLKAENRLDSQITIYCMRHTYCTMLLRKPPKGAGLDIRTVQQCMGHSDIKTTMEYLHYIEPEEHPTDSLPY